jgi:hypothetical protein
LSALFAIPHLTLAAVWLGSMAYSLTVVQPRVARFFADDDSREEFLITLAHGNRWRVVELICVLVLTALGVIATAHRTVAVGYAVALVLYLGAAAVFVNVSWRHWPARVFALPAELPGFRRSLRRQAWAICVLVAAAFGTALTVSVAAH